MINEKLLEILACPVCADRPKVELKDEELVCIKCGRRYSIRDSVPIMLAEEAKPALPEHKSQQ